MRTNLPVTETEHLLKDDQLIVSSTDLKGRITHFNRDFLDISGFTEEELLGAPHNLIRHPDMPAAAFADLWKTVQSGRPWTGIVKNRCKNGDFYWVEANISALREQGKVLGLHLGSAQTHARADRGGGGGPCTPAGGQTGADHAGEDLGAPQRHPYHPRAAGRPDYHLAALHLRPPVLRCWDCGRRPIRYGGSRRRPRYSRRPTTICMAMVCRWWPPRAIS